MESVLSLIQYYAREKYWHSIIQTCNQQLSRGADPMLGFWKAFGLFNEGAVTEALRELRNVGQRREAAYAACIASIYYHKNCKLVDQEAVANLKANKENLQTQAPDVSLLLAAQFMSLTGKYLKAKQKVVQVLDRNQSNLQALTVYGWIELYDSQGDHTSAYRAFDSVLENGGDFVFTKYIDSLMGKAKYFGEKKNFQSMLEAVNDILVKNPKYLPALIEKAKVMMMIGAWDELVEAAQRIMVVQSRNIEALRIWTFHAIAREAAFDVAHDKLKQLHQALIQKQPKNPSLYIDIAKPLARIAGRKRMVLQQTIAIVQAARQQRPDDSQVLIELGEQYRFLGDYNTAIKAFTEASERDEGNLMAVYKIIHTKILQEKYVQASQQLEFLLQIQESSKKSAELVFLSSLLAWRKDGNQKQAIKLLDSALSLHVATSKNLNPGMEFYAKLNPDFLLEISKQYLQYFGLKNLPKTEKPPHYLVRAAKLLQTITRQIPGIIQCHLLLAKAKFITNQFQASQRYISIALQLDPDCIDALLLLALIQMQNSQYRAASQALQQALSRNFMIRDNPMFMLVRGQVEMKQQKWPQALKTFQAAVNLPGLKGGEIKKKAELFITLSEEDKAMIYTNLALCYAQNDRLPDAQRVMTEAIGQFTGTSAEIHVIIANSELAIKKGDTKQSLNILKSITPDKPNYKHAQTTLAEIYLSKLQNRRLYAKCYYDIVASDDSVQNYLLLGQALMRIQQPEQAIKVYQKALRHKPDDLFLTKEIGRALVLTHDYQRAIQYYESAVRSDPRKSELLVDLAKLYLRLKDFQSANLVLDQIIKSAVTDIPSMKKAAAAYFLQGKVFLRMTRNDDPMNLQPLPNAVNALENARTLQKDILSSSRDLAPEQITIQREICSDIHYQLAEYYLNRESDMSKARQYYMESLQHNEMNIKSIIALAKLHQRAGDQAGCIQFYNRLITISPSNEEAAFLMAEIYLQQNNVQQALGCYKRLLENKSDQYQILSKLLFTLLRAGKLEEFENFLNKAVKSKGRNSNAGYSYCKGLLYRYSGKVFQAIQQFNKSRNDAVYGVLSIQKMIETYLNPEEDVIWQADRVNPENVQSAEQLLKELLTKSRNLRTTILNCQIQIAKGNKQSIDSAVSKLNEILAVNDNYVPAIVTLALSKCMLNKLQQARPILELLLRIPYQADFSEDFQKGWLILAQIYLNSKNYSQAGELLTKVLQYNQSSSKALEMLGVIRETEADLQQAVFQYQTAWKNGKSGNTGYKLAFNLLKARRFVEAIDVCREVLKLYPDYPSIRQEILAKAIDSLKPQ